MNKNSGWKMLNLSFTLTAVMAPAQGSTAVQMLTINGIQLVKHGIKAVLF